MLKPEGRPILVPCSIDPFLVLHDELQRDSWIENPSGIVFLPELHSRKHSFVAICELLR